MWWDLETKQLQIKSNMFRLKKSLILQRQQCLSLTTWGQCSLMNDNVCFLIHAHVPPQIFRFKLSVYFEFALYTVINQRCVFSCVSVLCPLSTASETALADVALNILCLLMKEQWSWICTENIQRTIRLLFGTLINRWRGSSSKPKRHIQSLWCFIFGFSSLPCSDISLIDCFRCYL